MGLIDRLKEVFSKVESEEISGLVFFHKEKGFIFAIYNNFSSTYIEGPMGREIIKEEQVGGTLHHHLKSSEKFQLLGEL